MYTRLLKSTMGLAPYGAIPIKREAISLGTAALIAGIGATASTAAAGINAASMSAASNQNYDIWKEAKDWQEGMMGRQQTWAREDATTAFERQRQMADEVMTREQEYNSPKNQLRMLREAGVNPNDGLGNWTLNGQSASAPQANTVTGGANPGLPDMSLSGKSGEAIAKGVERLGDIAMKIPQYRAQVNNIEANTEAVEAQRQKTLAEQRYINAAADKSLYDFGTQQEIDRYLDEKIQILRNKETGEVYSPQLSSYYGAEAPEWASDASLVETLGGDNVFSKRAWLEAQDTLGYMQQHQNERYLGFSRDQFNILISDYSNSVLKQFDKSPKEFKQFFGCSKDELASFMHTKDYRTVMAQCFALSAQGLASKAAAFLSGELGKTEDVRRGNIAADTALKGSQQENVVADTKNKGAEFNRINADVERIKKTAAGIADWRGPKRQAALFYLDAAQRVSNIANTAASAAEHGTKAAKNIKDTMNPLNGIIGGN